MKLEDFNSLSDEEKATYLSSIESTQKQLEDVTAERDSFRSENDGLLEQAAANSKELKATKELNFTLARKINVSPVEDDETTIYNFMKGFKRL